MTNKQPICENIMLAVHGFKGIGTQSENEIDIHVSPEDKLLFFTVDVCDSGYLRPFIEVAGDFDEETGSIYLVVRNALTQEVIRQWKIHNHGEKSK